MCVCVYLLNGFRLNNVLVSLVQYLWRRFKTVVGSHGVTFNSYFTQHCKWTLCRNTLTAKNNWCKTGVSQLDSRCDIYFKES